MNYFDFLKNFLLMHVYSTGSFDSSFTILRQSPVCFVTIYNQYSGKTIKLIDNCIIDDVLNEPVYCTKCGNMSRIYYNTKQFMCDRPYTCSCWQQLKFEVNTVGQKEGILFCNNCVETKRVQGAESPG